MIRPTLFFLLINFLLVNALLSQRTDAVYFEALGAGFLYSVNYETRFRNAEDGPGLRVGFGLVPSGREAVVFLPVQYSHIFGSGNGRVEIGIGVTPSIYISELRNGPLFGRNNSIHFFPAGTLMYRYQPEHSSMLFRVGWSPIFFRLRDDYGGHFTVPYFLLFPGVSIGTRF